MDNDPTKTPHSSSAYEITPRHVDMLSAYMESKLPEADEEGILGTLELGGAERFNPDEGMLDYDKQTRTILLVDLVKEGSKKLLGDCDIPEGARIALIDPKGVQKGGDDGKITRGIAFMRPGEAELIGRKKEGHSETLDIRPEETLGISRGHVHVRVDEEGNVFVRDNNSTNGTVISTGKYARDALEAIGDHHEHALYLKQQLGMVAVEQTLPKPAEQRETKPKEYELPSIEGAKKRIEAIISSDQDSTLANELRALGSSPEEIIAKLNKNKGKGDEEARSRIRDILTTRLHMLMETMPTQVKDNAEKNTSNHERHGLRQKMPSREYVVELALSYLDGSFDPHIESRDGHGPGGVGEHRQAAQKILESFTPEEKPEEGEQLEFTEDRLKAYLIELKATADVMVHNLENVAGATDNLQHDLQMGMTDTDQLGYNMGQINQYVEHILDTINEERRKLGNLKQFLEPGSSDESEAELVLQRLGEALNTLDSVRNASVYGYMQALPYNEDQMLVMQLQQFAHKNEFNDQISNQLRRVGADLNTITEKR